MSDPINSQSSYPRQARLPAACFIPIGDGQTYPQGEPGEWVLVPYQVGMPCLHAATQSNVGEPHEGK